MKLKERFYFGGFEFPCWWVFFSSLLLLLLFIPSFVICLTETGPACTAAEPPHHSFHWTFTQNIALQRHRIWKKRKIQKGLFNPKWEYSPEFFFKCFLAVYSSSKSCWLGRYLEATLWPDTLHCERCDTKAGLKPHTVWSSAAGFKTGPVHSVHEECFESSNTASHCARNLEAEWNVTIVLLLIHWMNSVVWHKQML